MMMNAYWEEALQKDWEERMSIAQKSFLKAGMTPQQSLKHAFYWEEFLPVSRDKFLERWLGYSNEEYPETCVYLLGDFYIGSTKQLRSRLLAHLRGVFSNSKRYSLEFKQRFWDAFLLGKRVQLCFVDNDVLWENYHIERFRRSGFPLVNRGPGREHINVRKIGFPLSRGFAYELTQILPEIAEQYDEDHRYGEALLELREALLETLTEDKEKRLSLAKNCDPQT